MLNVYLLFSWLIELFIEFIIALGIVAITNLSTTIYQAQRINSHLNALELVAISTSIYDCFLITYIKMILNLPFVVSSFGKNQQFLPSILGTGIIFILAPQTFYHIVTDLELGTLCLNSQHMLHSYILSIKSEKICFHEYLV